MFLLAVPSAIAFAITLARWRFHLRRGTRMDASAAASGVVIAEGSDPVAELVLDLKIPRSQSGMSVEETNRELHVRPFMIETASGERIDVEPPREVCLHAYLGKAHKIEHLRRYTKTAHVRPGDRVYLTGQLRDAVSATDGPFRDGEHRHRSIAPSLISTERLGGVARVAAARDKKWLVRWAVMTVLGPLPYVIPIIAFFVFAFWIRDMIVARVWWERKRYREWYGSGTTHEDRREYE
jgi:hypothetical protein